MVLCIIPGCGVKSGNKEGISLFRIPIVVDKNGESYKQLTEDRRNASISEICRDDTKSKDILNSERVCGRHCFWEACLTLEQIQQTASEIVYYDRLKCC